MNFEQNSGHRMPISVLLAVPDIEQALRLRRQLEPYRCIVHLAQDASEIEESLGRFRPDAILLDAELAAADHKVVFTGLSRRSSNSAIPVVMLADDGVPPGWVVRLGANAVVPKRSCGALIYRTIVACLATVSCAA
ncbi:MAG: response regulator [Candidatus Edwardsbacteria bacterium]|nr:response regulator [Candidatus Edwardsbacteria bacterium]